MSPQTQDGVAWRAMLAAVFLLSLASCGPAEDAAATSRPTSPPSTLSSQPAATPRATHEKAIAPPASATSATMPTAARSLVQDGTIKDQIDKLAAWFIAQGRNPGLAFAVVVRNPQTGQLESMELTYGQTAKDAGQAVDPKTIFEIGSITKVFTGILLAEAVGAGQMRLEDPIQGYLPDGIQAPTYQGVPITLVDLATHRSGLPRDAISDSMDDIYRWLGSFELSREPGSEYAYSNLGYSILGDILARQANSDFDTLEYKSVSQPLGLIDTREALDDEQTARLASAYTYDGSPAGYFPQSGAMSSAGYMHSTLDDMTRFLIENMQPGDSPLSGPLNISQAVQAGGRNPGTGVGLGWEVDALGTSSERLYKGGATLGFTSYISFMGDGSSGFVLLSNGMYVENLVPHMLRILAGK